MIWVKYIKFLNYNHHKFDNKSTTALDIIESEAFVKKLFNYEQKIMPFNMFYMSVCVSIRTIINEKNTGCLKKSLNLWKPFKLMEV